MQVMLPLNADELALLHELVVNCHRPIAVPVAQMPAVLKIERLLKGGIATIRQAEAIAAAPKPPEVTPPPPPPPPKDESPQEPA